MFTLVAENYTKTPRVPSGSAEQKQPSRGVLKVFLLCSFIEITLQHGLSPVNLLHIFRTHFLRTPMESCFRQKLLIEKQGLHLESLTSERTVFTVVIRSSHPEVLLGKGVLKIYSKFIGRHPCRSAISIKFLCNFIETAFRHECPRVNLLHIFRTFPKNTSEGLLLWLCY